MEKPRRFQVQEDAECNPNPSMVHINEVSAMLAQINASDHSDYFPDLIFRSLTPENMYTSKQVTRTEKKS